MEGQLTARSSRRRTSPSRRSLSKGKNRIPIKYISIEVKDEERDDGEVNELVSAIRKKAWGDVLARLQMQEGINECSRELPNKDYALHAICRCGTDYKESKYRSFRGNAAPRVNIETTSSHGSGDLSSRASSITSGSTPSGETIPSSETITTHTKDESEKLVTDSLPPRAVLEGVLNAYPEACRVAGEGDATPLHWAVRHRYPLPMLNVLIRAFPQALDKKDLGTRTPRNYSSIVVSSQSRSALLRPTSCWLQHLHDERKRREMTHAADILESEVLSLHDSLKVAQAVEQSLQQRVLKIEKELNSFGDLRTSNGFTTKAFEIRDELEGSMDIIRVTLEGLVGQTMMKYADEEKERAHLSAFNADVERIYNNANETLEELSLELEKITLGLTEN